MPFKSQAQRRKFYAMEDRGEISKSTVDEWEAATPRGKKLIEKVKQAGLYKAALSASAAGTLAGAGVGAAGGGLLGYLGAENDHKVRDAVIGALGGGLAGSLFGKVTGSMAEAGEQGASRRWERASEESERRWERVREESNRRWQDGFKARTEEYAKRSREFEEELRQARESARKARESSRAYEEARSAREANSRAYEHARSATDDAWDDIDDAWDDIFGRARRGAGTGRSQYSWDDWASGAERGRSAPPPRSQASTPPWVGDVKTKAEAKAAFRREAMKHHPDRGGSEEKMKAVNTAWDKFTQSRDFDKLAHLAFVDELVKIADVVSRFLAQAARHEIMPVVNDAIGDTEEKVNEKWRRFSNEYLLRP